MSDDRTLRLGTRHSPLALAQAAMVRDTILARCPDLTIDIVEITSEGDVDMRPLADFPDRGVFATALERELSAGTIDIAVHSFKDMQLADVDGLTVCAVLAREDPRDALCNCAAGAIEDLPADAVIATGSARRSSILRTLRADLQPSNIRGNVGTRLATSAARGDAACMLACAGLRRLGRGDEIAIALPVDQCVPDAAQGVVAIQIASDSPWRTELPWNEISHDDTAWAAAVERRVARDLGGGCEQPIGVHVTHVDEAWVCYVFRAPAAGEAGVVHAVAIERTVTVDVVADLVLANLPLVGAPS